MPDTFVSGVLWERATRERVSIGVALRACWSTLRTRYRVSRYEDIEGQY